MDMARSNVNGNRPRRGMSSSPAGLLSVGRLTGYRFVVVRRSSAAAAAYNGDSDGAIMAAFMSCLYTSVYGFGLRSNRHTCIAYCIAHTVALQ